MKGSVDVPSLKTKHNVGQIGRHRTDACLYGGVSVFGLTLDCPWNHSLHETLLTLYFCPEFFATDI